MTNPISPIPVTENEMRAFFDRIVNLVLSQSELDKTVREMKATLDDTTQRLNTYSSDRDRLYSQVEALVAERNQLRSRNDEMAKEVSDLYELNQTTETKLAAASQNAEHWQKAFDEEVRERRILADSYKEKEAQIVELESQVKDTQAKLSQREQSIDYLNNRVQNSNSDAEHYRKSYVETEYKLKEANEKLTQVMENMNKILYVVNPPTQVSQTIDKPALSPEPSNPVYPQVVTG